MLLLMHSTSSGWVKPLPLSAAARTPLPPLVAALTEHARWLPGLAGMQLYDSTDAVLTAGTGTLVLTAWILLVGAVAATRFVRTDA